jgi:hypothetical protein
MCQGKNIEVSCLHCDCKTIGVVVALVAIVVLPLPFANAQGNGRGKGNSSQQHRLQSQAPGNHTGQESSGQRNGTIGSSLSAPQVEQLVRVLEEEKLAHDIYVVLGKTSGLQIFNAIAKAESQHMRAVEQLLSVYSAAAARVKNLPAGSFSNPQLQALYESLVATGTASPIDAVKVGIMIEEMDIRDLRALLSANPSQEVARVLERLQRGSEHHLRAFVGELDRLGGVYTSQYLKETELEQVVNPMARSQGNVQFNNRVNRPAGKPLKGERRTNP